MNKNEELVEFSLLDKRFLSFYDLAKTEENVYKIMNNFFRSQYKYTNILPPRMTPNYEIKYEYLSLPSGTDKLGNYVCSRLDTEQEIIAFYNTMAGAISRMNMYEKVYYTELLLNGKSERYTADCIGVSRNGMTPIKNSCIMKIALAFGKEVERKV